MIPAFHDSKWRWQLAAIASVAVFLGLVVRFCHPVHGFTVFFQLDTANNDLKIAEFRELPVYVHRDTGGYDGLYYAQIAQDPTLRHPDLPGAMDNFSYRARRILPPALAWLLGAGRAEWIVTSYSLLNVGAWLILAVLLWRLLAVRELRGWIAWAGLLFSAGVLSSVRLALTDLPALALLTATLFADESGRRRGAAGLLAAAGLARETILPALATLVDRPWLSRRNLLLTLGVVAPLAAWLAYVRWRAGPADYGWSNFGFPGGGLLEKWTADLAAVRTPDERALAWTTLLTTLGLTVQAGYFLSRWRPADRWWRLGAVFAVMLLFLGQPVWAGFPGAASRVLLPLTLAFNVCILRRRLGLAWLLAGNLTVGAGLLALRDVPHNADEFAAGRSQKISWIVRAGAGWQGREDHRQHTWQWTEERGRVRIETWPEITADATIRFGLRSPSPGTVAVRQDGRELARLTVGPTLSSHTLPIRIESGIAHLEFAGDMPPIPESAAHGARRLGFALYDLRLTLAEP